MAVLNVHERALRCSEEALGALIDSLASDEDKLWPRRAWPPMTFDRPLGVGATGGHGPIRYRVSDYVPGRWIRFRFTGPRGFDGFHEFTTDHADDGRAVLRHTIAMYVRGPARLTWPLMIRPLHDALLEDSLDCAERAITGLVSQPAQWSRYVRFLRRIRGRRQAP